MARGRIDESLMTLQVQTPSRKRLKAGDIFVMKILDKGYLFGRVIRTDALGGAAGNDFDVPRKGNLNLIYIYEGLHDSKEPIPGLCKEELLVPPIVTNRLGWSSGYFETVDSRELEEEDVLRPHCFSLGKPRGPDGMYYDEYGNRLDREYPPTGLDGLSSYVGIDARISKALGLPIRWRESEPKKPSVEE